MLHLLQNAPAKWDVTVLTRNPESAEAKALAQKVAALRRDAPGVQGPAFSFVKGDCLHPASLAAAFSGAYGVFGVTNPFTQRWTGKGAAHTDVGAEEQQGLNMVDAAKAAGVRHFVFASVASAGDDSGVPTFDAKWRVELYLRASGVPHTVIAPVGFMENMESPFAGLKQGVMPGLLKHGTKAQFISTHDIGWFVADAFAHPAEYLGLRLEVAGDELTADQQAEIIARVRGDGPWKVSTPPDWVFKLFIPKAVGSLKHFLESKGCKADVAECRRRHPGLMSFEQWLRFTGIDKKHLPSPGLCTIQ